MERKGDFRISLSSLGKLDSKVQKNKERTTGARRIDLNELRKKGRPASRQEDALTKILDRHRERQEHLKAFGDPSADSVDGDVDDEKEKGE
ncbi:MAG TPA: hypothetical protein DEB09_05690 [Candidatus Magasanikbacteria bacterium]|nr:hypothetical protein [Candidatus Magasanikbacteria bacterium]